MDTTFSPHVSVDAQTPPSVFERLLCGVDNTLAGLAAARLASRVCAPEGSLVLLSVEDPSIAVHAGWAELAWSAQRFLRASGLPDYVSVCAKWRTHEDLPRLADINLTVTVSRHAEAASAALAAALANSLAARSLAEPVVHISLEGVNR